MPLSSGGKRAGGSFTGLGGATAQSSQLKEMMFCLVSSHHLANEVPWEPSSERNCSSLLSTSCFSLVAVLCMSWAQVSPQSAELENRCWKLWMVIGSGSTESDCNSWRSWTILPGSSRLESDMILLTMGRM